MRIARRPRPVLRPANPRVPVTDRKMAGIARPPTATEYTDRRRAAAKWTPRLASAGLAALLLALGVGRNRNRARGATPAENKSIAAPRLTAKQFVLELYKRISDDRIVAISAGVTFFL